VIRLLTPGFFERAELHTKATESELDKIKVTLLSAFSEADAAVISGRAADVFDVVVLPSLRQDVRLITGQDSETPCSCNQRSDFCFGQFFCFSIEPYCESLWWGCGWFFQEVCDGVCCWYLDGVLQC
jgi:hypothetical protein